MPDTPNANAATAEANPTATVTTAPATGETSNAAPPAPAPAEQPTAPEPTATVDPKLQAELETAKADAEKWRELARKHEGRAKANADAARQLEEAKRANMSEQERIVDTVRAEARTEAIREFGGRLVRAEFRAASAGRIDADSLDTLLGALDLTRFLDENGEPKADEVAKFIATIVPAPPPPPAETTQPGAPAQQSTPAQAAAQHVGLPPLVQPQPDTGQGVGRSGTEAMPLNGDPIEERLRALLS